MILLVIPDIGSSPMRASYAQLLQETQCYRLQRTLGVLSAGDLEELLDVLDLLRLIVELASMHARTGSELAIHGPLSVCV